MPTKEDIDEVSGGHPVALSRVCGHVALLNSAALAIVGAESRSGPQWERDPSGALTGIVKEEAMTEAFSKVSWSADQAAADLLSAEGDALKLGLARVHSIVSPEGFRDELGALAQLHRTGSLSLEYRIYVPPESLEFVEEEGLRDALSDSSARVTGVKIYADGSLGARTAALHEPYSDDPGNTGLLRHTDEEMQELVSRADSMGLQVMVHAIGDRAVEQAVGAISRVSGTKNPLRHRVEHASLLPKGLRGSMANHGIRASVQPCFITSDTWAVARLGEERSRDLYPLKSMLREGLVVSGGSDAPIESQSPVLGIWSAMVRGGVAPEEALTFEEAASLYTAGSTSNGFDEASLAPGSPATFTLLDSDVAGMHPAMIRKVGAAAVVVGGELAYCTIVPG
jgi:predicted amidohydrolase YtcJ